MNYRRLGRSGLKVSELCLGAWINFGDRIDDDAAFSVLDTAVEEGINFFDTADAYAGGRAEEVMGRWMQGKDRRTLVVATKCRLRMWDGPNGEGNSRKHIIDACHDSLRRLKTDYIDLYQLHIEDPDTPIEETMRAMNELLMQGKIRYLGCSNFSSEAITESARVCEKLGLNKFISLQPIYHMLSRDIEKTIPRCIEEGLGLIPFSPLAQGMLTDKYLTGKAPAGSRVSGNKQLQDFLKKNLPTIRALGDFAHKRKMKLSQLALAWLLHQPAMVSPIIGATRPEQIRENVKAVDVKLTDSDLEKIDDILGATG